MNDNFYTLFKNQQTANHVIAIGLHHLQHTIIPSTIHAIIKIVHVQIGPQISLRKMPGAVNLYTITRAYTCIYIIYPFHVIFFSRAPRRGCRRLL